MTSQSHASLSSTGPTNPPARSSHFVWSSGGDERFGGRAVRQALAAEGFRLGKFDIFHKPGPDARAVLSTVSLTKPGPLALATMDTQRFGGPQPVRRAARSAVADGKHSTSC